MPLNSTSVKFFACPHCKNQFPITIVNILFAETSSNEVQQIKDGTFFTVTCPKCGNTQEVLYNILYQDTLRHFMIALQPDPAMPFPSPKDPSILDSFRLRIVRDAEDLADKISEMESAIDDRLIEIEKYLFYKKIRPSLPAGSIIGFPSFHVGEEGAAISLPLSIQGKGYAMGTDHLTEEKLSELQDSYGDVLAAETDRGFRVIDRKYAIDFLDFFSTYQEAKQTEE